MTILTFKHSRLIEWDENEEDKDVHDKEIDRVSKQFGDEGVGRI